MQLLLHPRTLPLADPFRVAHETRTDQPTLIVELRAGGLSGFGEAPLTRYYGLDPARCLASLQTLAPAFAPYDLAEFPTHMREFLVKRAPGLHPFLVCALDVALEDLRARHAGLPLRAYWNDRGQSGAATAGPPPTCYTIGLAPVAEMVRKLRAKPWPVYKIKLGGGGDDVATVRALRQHTDAPFYVDANTGWTAEQTIAYSHELAELGVVFIEQPLPVADRAGQRRVYEGSALPLMADESCQTAGDVVRCLDLFHGVNIKIVKCGGLTPARTMIGQARRLGLRVMAGCMTESSFGISAIAQLLPQLDYADLDGAMLLAEDPGVGVTFDPATGQAVYPDENGTGARWRT